MGKSSKGTELTEIILFTQTQLLEWRCQDRPPPVGAAERSETPSLKSITAQALVCISPADESRGPYQLRISAREEHA